MSNGAPSSEGSLSPTLQTAVESGGRGGETPAAPTEAPPTAVEAGTAICWPDEAQLSAGSVEVPGYAILGELGRGGMGVVYRARDVTLNRPVALKMILAGGHAGAAELARFKTEAEAIARLQHPNVVQIYEVGEADGHPYLALELIDSGSLAARLGTPLTAEQAAPLTETLARAIHEAHHKGIVHRDLKPANILLAVSDASQKRSAEQRLSEASLNDCVPKITDFGLAKLLDRGEGQTGSGAVMGTPSYMAPEQAAGKTREVGPAADVWALGAILYECLTGRPPFQGTTVLDTLQQVLTVEPVSPARLQQRVPQDLETICLKCLQKEPVRRYASAFDLAEDLRRFLHNEPILARPPGMLYRLRKFAQRNKGLVAGVTAVFLALLVGVIGTSVGLVRARVERDRARVSEETARAGEREVNRLLTASHYDAARLAIRRGGWGEALRQIDLALANGPDSAELRFDQVRAWCAVHDIPRARRGIQELAGRKDLGDLEGRILLLRADLELNGASPHREQALAQVQQALDKGLPAAEKEYALGLLAPTSPEAVEHFQRAVERDPFNPRLNGMLALLLTSLGKRQGALDQLRLSEQLFPEDPTFRVIHAMLCALEDNKVAAAAQLKKAGQLRPKQRATAQALIALCGQLPRLGRLLEGLLADNSTGMLPALLGIQSAVGASRAVLSDPEGDLFLPVPPVLHKAFRQLPSVTELMTKSLLDKRGLAKQFEAATTIHPEGFLFLTCGVLRAGSDDRQGWTEADKAFLRAAETPSLFPVRRAALFGAVSSEWVLSREKDTPAVKAEMRRRAAHHLRELLPLSLRPQQAYFLSVMALEMKELGPAAWIIDEWERQAPNDPRLKRQQALLRSKQLEAPRRGKEARPGLSPPPP